MSAHRPVARRALPALLLLAAALGARGMGAQTAAADGALAAADSALVPPPIAREFRGVWVATVANIDWPSRPGLSTWEQQAELLAILNRAAAMRLNAVVLQVRPAADALYASRLEPWSPYLTGQMGRAPEPFWDPLAFAVREAHARGLELHAWFNPYRALHPSAPGAPGPTHVSVTHPGMVRSYGRYLWLDPGDPAVRRHSLGVILDVVRRYDIDGVHIDDYFYPYRERDSVTKQLLDFPDDSSWRRYVRGGGKLSRNDWRRRNVNELVRQLYAGIKAAKPWVKFGVSPFGIWRSGHPPEVTGLDPYVELYADSRTWLVNGWLDYFTPQLYWPIQSQQSYPTLLAWWVEQNTRRRHIWPGNFTSRVGATGTPSWRADELLEQIRLTRAQAGATGNVHFSARAFMQSRDSLVERLVAGAYAEPALVPASPWLDRRSPARPAARLGTDRGTGGLRVELRPAGTSAPRWWVVQTRAGDAWGTVVLPGDQKTHLLTSGPAVVAPDVVAVTAVDRAGNASRPAILRPAEARGPAN